MFPGGSAQRDFGAHASGALLATFVSRPNRFVVECLLEGRVIRAWIANPGRMRETLVPGATLLLHPSGDPRRRLAHSVVAVRRHGTWVGTDTQRANRLARTLIDSGRVPGLQARVARTEVRHGSSRLDFLLEDGTLLEVKSCTLAGRRTAMFPDAATERGRRHLEELAHLGGTVLFLVQSPTAELFLPDWHADLAFARTMVAVRHQVRFLPVAFSLDESLQPGPVRTLRIPWDVAERDTAEDRGCYLAVEADSTLRVGTARERLARAGHRLKREVFPVRTALDLEEELREAVEGLTVADPRFQEVLLHFRTDRLTDTP